MSSPLRLISGLVLVAAAAFALSDSKSEAIDRLLRDCERSGQFNGTALVAEEGKVVFQKGFGFANLEWQTRNSLDTRFEIASMTKALTAIVVLQLVEEGKVRLDGHVSDYVPYYPKHTGDKITIDQLLTHTSGLQQDIGFPDGSDVPPIVAKLNADLLTNDEMVKLIAARPLRFEPGTNYGYSSDGYAVLGAVIEHVTKGDYYDEVKLRIFDRIGMSDTVPARLTPIVLKRAMGYEVSYSGIANQGHVGATPAGGFYSTVGDLLKLDTALYGDRLLGEASRKRLFTQRKAITGYGWKTAIEEIGGRKVDVFRTTGGLPGFINVLQRVPSKRRTIILLSNMRGRAYYLDAITSAINQILDGKTPVTPRRSIAEALNSEIGKRGITAAMLAFESWSKDDKRFYVDEAELNNLGYFLLATKDAATALPIFIAITDRFPDSWNAFDSLGEALMAAGRKPESIKAYERSLLLNPKNSNADQMIKKLRGG